MQTMKRALPFKAIAIILIISFFALDVSWAQSIDRPGRNSDLAAQYVSQREMMTDEARLFQKSIFADFGLCHSLVCMGKYLLEGAEGSNGPVAPKYLKSWLARNKPELAAAFSDIGIELSQIQGAVVENGALKVLDASQKIPDNGVALVLYKNSRRDCVIQIALKGNEAGEKLIGYEYILLDRYLVKTVPRDYEGMPEKKAVVVKPVTEVSAPQAIALEATGKSEGKLSIKAIVSSALLFMAFSADAIAGEVAASAGKTGSAGIFSARSMITWIVALITGLILFNSIWRRFVVFKRYSRRLLESRDDSEIFGLVEELRRFGRRAVPVLVEKAAEILEDESSWHNVGLSAREELFNTLQNIGDPRSAGVLIKSLGYSGDAEFPLVHMKDPALAGLLITALSDKNKEVREYVAGILGMRKEHSAIAPLRDLLGDKYTDVAKAAACALARINDEKTTEDFRKELLGKDMRKREISIYYFGSLPGGYKFKDTREEVIFHILDFGGSKELVKMGPAAIPFIIEILNDDTWDYGTLSHLVGALWTMLLAGTKDERAMACIEGLFLKHKSARVREYARSALFELKGPEAVPQAKISDVIAEIEETLNAEDAYLQAQDKFYKFDLISADRFEKMRDMIPSDMTNIHKALRELKPLSEEWEDADETQIMAHSVETAENISESIMEVTKKYSLSKDEAHVVWLAMTRSAQRVRWSGLGETAEKVAGLFSMLEEHFNTNKAAFVDAGNKIIAFLDGLPGRKGKFDELRMDDHLFAAGLKKRANAIIAAVGKADAKAVPEDIAAGVILLKKNLEQVEVDSVISSLIALVNIAKGYGKEMNQELIIGIETGWLPGADKKDSLQASAVEDIKKEIRALEAKMRSMGLNVVFILEDGEELATALVKEADRTHTALSNIIALISERTHSTIGFRNLRSEEDEKKAFIAFVSPANLEKYCKGNKDSMAKLDINIIEMLSIVLEVASGKEPPKLSMVVSYNKKLRVMLLRPPVEEVNYEQLRERNKARLRALQSA